MNLHAGLIVMIAVLGALVIGEPACPSHGELSAQKPEMVTAGSEPAVDFSLGGWEPASRMRFGFASDGHSSEILTLSEQPSLHLVRGLLTAAEVATLESLVVENFEKGRFGDRGLRHGERNVTWSWVPDIKEVLESDIIGRINRYAGRRERAGAGSHGLVSTPIVHPHKPHVPIRLTLIMIGYPSTGV